MLCLDESTGGKIRVDDYKTYAMKRKYCLPNHCPFLWLDMLKYELGWYKQRSTKSVMKKCSNLSNLLHSYSVPYQSFFILVAWKGIRLRLVL